MYVVLETDEDGVQHEWLRDKHGQPAAYQRWEGGRVTFEAHLDRDGNVIYRRGYEYDPEDGSSTETIILDEQVVTGSPDGSDDEPDMTFTEEEAWGPDSQPAPDAPLATGSMPCPATHRDCGAGAEEVSRFEKVAQPGRGDEGGTEQGFKASIEERTDVVTNPVDPGTQLMTGGGGQGPRPIEHVTKPGKE